MIKGFTTTEGTKAFAHRFFRSSKLGFFRNKLNLILSSIGLGTYLGEPDEVTDQKSYEVAKESIEKGINVIDSAINYRAQRSERVIGRVLKDLIENEKLRREELFLSTKGGFIPFDGTYPADVFDYIEKKFIETGIISEKDVIQSCHVMTPKYLEHQIETSLNNFGVETIDLYYLHNPETQLEELSDDEFYFELKKAFELLEQKVKENKIKMYGIATWNGLRLASQSQGYLSLAKILKIANEAGGGSHHFKAIQLPFNLAMPEAFVSQNQDWQGEMVSAIEFANRANLLVFASASLLQGKLAKLPEKIRKLFSSCKTEAACALQFVRSTPGLTSGLVGMKSLEHVQENLGISEIPPVTEDAFFNLFTPQD